MNAILSIKPKYVAEIVAGRKRYEFRKAVFKQHVEKVYVYASAPLSRIIGEFEPVDILAGEPDKVWQKTRKFSGITKRFFDEYFEGRTTAYAIVIQNFRLYDEAAKLPKGIHAPQSFCYYEHELHE